MSDTAARTSFNAERLNKPRLIGGVPWEMAVGMIVFFSYAAFMMRAPLYLLPGLMALGLFRSAASRDHLFLQIYRRHRMQADVYTPAPVSQPQTKQRRPRGYGRYDPN